MKLLRALSGAIDAFRPADGPPPQKLGAFFGWCLRGGWGPLAIAAGVSALAGTTEVVSAMILGLVVDAAVQSSDPATFFSTNMALLAMFVTFYLLARPLAFAASAASNAIIVGPNVMPLVLSRLHRWTMGQAVTFFDNDFAGRIASRVMETGYALRASVVQRPRGQRGQGQRQRDQASARMNSAHRVSMPAASTSSKRARRWLSTSHTPSSRPSACTSGTTTSDWAAPSQ